MAALLLSPFRSTKEGGTYIFRVAGPGKAPLTPNIEKIVFYGTVVERSMLDSMGLLKLTNLRWDRTSPYNIKDIKGLTLTSDLTSKSGYSGFLTPTGYQWSVSPVTVDKGGKTRKRINKTRKHKSRNVKNTKSRKGYRS
jgi:hypothetical protein